MTDTAQPLLRVEDLTVRYATAVGSVEALKGVGFELGREKLGIVGESGSGKSTLGRAILKLIPSSARLTATRLDFMGRDLRNLGEAEMRLIRGKQISMILQDPKYSLNPIMRAGDQILEALAIHGETRGRARVIEILKAVRIRDPERVYNAYPHELSGGMGQRVMTAMMLVTNPLLLIADEPTSALDVTVRMQVLAIIDDLVTQRGMGLIFISHDLNLVGSFCDRILIMYGGRIVETCRASELQNCRHPYTRGLLQSMPSIEHPRDVLPTLKRDPAWLRGN
ncbi:ABC transporter ATP-binding protein [Hypericibacter adhaerens]|jgi:peptide/nickel transport system ATP-binding protein|uniref:ABC transporter ATP-binding protein n=1 Tax=Hypericibacter adhaerens TaxID=2602016 RepID=A0A5J6MY47_9PROT|nr:ABC transporter ATP-binding protein [Hypericibacter adhaerens]QEX21863.1 ABC transporter ATP-binding protein [Hypericibacter adhaerens]